MSRLGTRNGKRFRRARRRGRMTPAIADRISSRSRETRWPVTKRIKRYHSYHWKRYFKTDWVEDD